jgi:hypothetical protein
MDPGIGKDYVMPLAKAFARLQTATAVVSERGLKNPDEAGAASWDYLNLFALVALGFMWARMAEVAKQKLAEGEGDKDFYETKLVTARFFMDRMLPDTAAQLAKIQAGSESTMMLKAANF